MKSYLLVHKASLYCVDIITGTLKKTENDDYKVIEIPENILNTAYGMLNKNKDSELLALVQRGRLKKANKYIRNTSSDQYKKDRAAAMERVRDGGAISSTAKKFNINPSTLRSWIWKEDNAK